MTTTIHTDTDTDTGEGTRRRQGHLATRGPATRRLVAGAAVLALLVGAGAACGSDDDLVQSSSTSAPAGDETEGEGTDPTAPDGATDAAAGEPGAGATPVGGDPATGGAAAGAGQGGASQPAGGGSSGGQPAGGQPAGGQQGGGSPQAAAPVVTSFEHPDSIDCHNGNVQSFTMRWSTTGADSVTIAIDGPGVYDSYGPSGEASLPFNCGSPHSFLLTAHGPGGTATKQVTLHPRNVQGSPGEPEDQMDQN